MDLEKLSGHAMLAVCERWLQDMAFRSLLRIHDVGVAIRVRLQEIYGELVELHAEHLSNELRQLGTIAILSSSQLRLVGCRLHPELSARIERESSPTKAAKLRELRDVLFPNGPTSLATRPLQISDAPVPAPQSKPTGNSPLFTRLTQVQWKPTTYANSLRTSSSHRGKSTEDQNRINANRLAQLRSKWSKIVRAVFVAIDLIPMASDRRSRLATKLRASIFTIARSFSNADAPASRHHAVAMVRTGRPARSTANDDTLECEDGDLETIGDDLFGPPTT